LCTDPDTPAEYATVKLTAKVEPSDEDVVFLVDGVPVARVGYPHEFRWSLTPGIHSIRVALLDRPTVSEPITIVVKD
jgi:penicillin-binding protein 1C